VAAAQAGDPRRHHGALHVRCADRRSWHHGGETSEAGEFFEAADAETVATIKELIETRVRPAVANDGGDITFRGFKDGVVYLDMKGACSGCPSSTATLKHGIQNLLRHFVPDVTEVRPI
jgi:Fe-S cluster biogenesis protein NfuA